MGEFILDPIIYLCIDNCFAAKRWIRPSEWMRMIQSLGLSFVEASADTECDPLHMGAEFTQDWIQEVRRCSSELRMAVKNVYSGHGTYITSGLAHYDQRVMLRFRDQWIKKQMDTAQALGACFGFFAHGFEDILLQDNALYEKKLMELYETLADIARYAYKIGMRYVGVEQMYSPHQPPWTISGTERLLQQVYRRAGVPFYFTADLGHMNGQQYFAQPDASYVREKITLARKEQSTRSVWVGSNAARSVFLDAVNGGISEEEAVRLILQDVGTYPHLFSQPEDWCVEKWVRALGCYSPIIHLQQSDGKSSPHWPFSREYNRRGIIKAENILRALISSFKQADDPQMPPKCSEVALTFEPFISTAGNTYDFLDDLAESVAYWRYWVPRDGMRLSEISQRMQ